MPASALARVLAPEPICTAIVAREPTLIGHPLAVDDAGDVRAHRAAEVIDSVSPQTSCYVVGPGLGISEPARAMTLRVVQMEAIPAVVDADAINALARVPELFRDLRAPAVLTPHPGEFARLSASLGLSLPIDTDAKRADSAGSLARRLGCVVVLKGARTVVSDGHRWWESSHAVPALATAGAGDVLAGVIAGLLAQRAREAASRDPATLLELACLGVEAHARAADSWVSTNSASGGMLASDLLTLIPHAIETLRAR